MPARYTVPNNSHASAHRLRSGLHASTHFTLGGTTTLTARGMLGWRHAFGDAPTSTAAFAGGAEFTVAGVPVARDTALFGLGLDLGFTPAATVSVSYDGQIGSGLVDQAVKATLSVRF